MSLGHLFSTGLCTHLNTHGGGGAAGEMGPISKLLPLQVPEPYFDSPDPTTQMW